MCTQAITIGIWFDSDIVRLHGHQSITGRRPVQGGRGLKCFKSQRDHVPHRPTVQGGIINCHNFKSHN